MRSILLLAVAVAGCSASGPPLTAVQSIPDSAQVVVVRPRTIVFSARSPDVHVNGRMACDLTNGGAFSRQVPPGEVRIATVNGFDMAGVSTLSFPAEAGGTYYVVVTPDRDRMVRMAIGSTLGALAAGGGAVGAAAGGTLTAAVVAKKAAASRTVSQGGPFLVDLIDEEAALAAKTQRICD